MAKAKFLQHFNKFSLAGKWSVALACIPFAVTVLIALVLYIFSEESGEFFSRGFRSLAVILIAAHIMPVTSIIGIILGAKASIRNKCKMAMTGVVLNLLILIGCFPVFKVRFGDSIAWQFSIEHRLEIAIKRGNIKAVEKYVKKGADVNFHNWHEETPLRYAISSKNIEILKVLLNNGADANQEGSNRDIPPLLHLLLLSDSNQSPAPEGWDELEAARLLLKKGANPNVIGHWPDKSPLFLAVEHGNEKMIDLLLAYGADINQKGELIPAAADYSAIHYAAYKGDTELALLLLDKGADVNIRGANKRTPLHKASSDPMIELLLSKGADPNALDRFGQPALKTKTNTKN